MKYYNRFPAKCRLAIFCVLFLRFSGPITTIIRVQKNKSDSAVKYRIEIGCKTQEDRTRQTHITITRIFAITEAGLQDIILRQSSFCPWKAVLATDVFVLEHRFRVLAGKKGTVLAGRAQNTENAICDWIFLV